MDVSSDTLMGCKISLGPQAYTTLFDFKKECTFHASTGHDSLSTEGAVVSTSGQLNKLTHSSKKKKMKKTKKKKAASVTPRKETQSEASVAAVQPNARDLVHTVWLNGPTYSKKIQTNRLGTGNWPTFAGVKSDTGYYSLFLRASNGHCITTTTGYDLSLGQCWGWSSGLSLAFGDDGALTDEDGLYVCADGDPATPASGETLVLSSACTSPGFAKDADGYLTHTATGLYLAPDTTGASYSSSYEAAGTTTLTLSTTVYKWGFWKAWNELPGYDTNGLLLGASLTTNTAATPPRYKVKLGAADGSSSCESFRTYGYGESGSVQYNMTLLNLDSGEYYPHSVNYIEHWAWPASCTLMFRHSSDTNDAGVYPDYKDDFNAFFGSGSRIRFEENKGGSGACNPKNARYTGYDSTSDYCYTTSNDLDDAPHLTLHSGWVGLVIDASVAKGNVLPKFGAVPDAVGNGTTAEIYAALPESELNVTLTTTSGVVYKLGKQSSDFAVVSVARQGIITSHILVTDLVWIYQGAGIAVIDIDPPQWWLEFEVRGTSMSVQVGWDELDVGSGCAVCENATVQIILTMEDQVLTNSVEFVAGEQFDTLSLVFEAGGKSFDTLDDSVDVTSDTCTVNYRTDKNDILLEVPTSMYSCGYSVACSPLVELDFTASNPNSEEAVVHLTISRNFPSRIDSLTQSRVGAEVRKAVGHIMCIDHLTCSVTCFVSSVLSDYWPNCGLARFKRPPDRNSHASIQEMG
jgi:hypothetical protein